MMQVNVVGFLDVAMRKKRWTEGLKDKQPLC